jgi:hypothetical protein
MLYKPNPDPSSKNFNSIIPLDIDTLFVVSSTEKSVSAGLSIHLKDIASVTEKDEIVRKSTNKLTRRIILQNI